jgi:AcrR family transcriptional regulator
MVRTTKPVEQRRQEILSTARQLFVANGYKNTSVADIASALGVAQGLIFHYYKSKAALLYAVFDEIAAEEQATLQSFLAQQPGRAIDCLEFLFSDSKQHKHYETFYQDLMEDPAVFEYWKDKMAFKSVPLAEELIRRGNSDGSWYCQYPQQTAHFIMSGISALIRNIACEGDTETMRRAIRSILLQTLGAGISEAMDDSSSQNGQISGGFSDNGHSPNPHSDIGRSDGHNDNGHSPNPHSDNGHNPNPHSNNGNPNHHHNNRGKNQPTHSADKAAICNAPSATIGQKKGSSCSN